MGCSQNNPDEYEELYMKILENKYQLNITRIFPAFIIEYVNTDQSRNRAEPPQEWPQHWREMAMLLEDIISY